MKKNERRDILRGLMASGDMPPQRELARRFKCGRTTIQFDIRQIKKEAQGDGSLAEFWESETTDKILSFLQAHKDRVFSFGSIAEKIDRAEQHVKSCIEALRERGYNIYIDGAHVGLTRDDGAAAATAEETPPDNVIRFGATSDWHLGCKSERLGALNTLYNWYAGEGIDTVYLAGNMIEGDARFNVRERYVHGIDQQVENFIEKAPRRQGITTRFVTGDDHEGWYQKDAGISIGRHLEHMARDAGREDLQYLGYMEHDIRYANAAGSFMVRVAHPGGGSAYALSYAPQKIVESYQGGEKPSVLLIGHYHKLEYIPHLRNVHVIQTGCFCDQTTYLRKNKISVHVGGWIVEIHQCPKTGAVQRCRVEVMTFYDRAFHQQWERY